jgi:two-component system OmpR family sensor kinase
VLAHDLRNRMAPVSLRLYALRRRAEASGRQDELEDLQLALKGLAGLGNLVTDLLDVARIDAGLFQVQPEPLDLVALVRDTAGSMSTARHAIQVRSREDISVVADPSGLRRCIENLLSNAVRYSPDEAPVTVLLSRQRRESGEWASVEVMDEGPGVPPEVLPRIFERFGKAERADGGLGLGLYVTRSIIAMHGGELTVDSPPGRGARFCALLPCTGATAARGAESTPSLRIVDGAPGQGGRG